MARLKRLATRFSGGAAVLQHHGSPAGCRAIHRILLDLLQDHLFMRAARRSSPALVATIADALMRQLSQECFVIGTDPWNGNCLRSIGIGSAGTTTRANHSRPELCHWPQAYARYWHQKHGKNRSVTAVACGGLSLPSTA